MRELTGIFLLASVACAALSSAEETGALSDVRSVAIGGDLYAHNCAACHGRCGHGDGSAITALPRRPKDLTNSDYWDDDDSDLLDTIKYGKGAMPKFSKLLTELQRRMVLGYVRSLAPKPVK